MGGVLKNTFIVGATQLAPGLVKETNIALEALTAANFKKEGTATYALTANGAGNVPTWQAIPSSASDMVKIATATLGSDTQTWTAFGSLTTTAYQYLVVVAHFKGAASANGVMNMRINADTGANYIGNIITGDTSTVSCGNGTTTYFQPSNYNVPSGGMQYTVFTIFSGTCAVNIRGITSSTISCASDGTGYRTHQCTGAWKSGSNITAIQFYTNANNIGTGSTATLYGVKV